MPPPTPEARLLQARLAAGDRKAALKVRLALKATKGNVTLAAERLGISRPTIHRWLEMAVFEGVEIPRRGRGRARKNRRAADDLA